MAGEGGFTQGRGEKSERSEERGNEGRENKKRGVGGKCFWEGGRERGLVCRSFWGPCGGGNAWEAHGFSLGVGGVGVANVTKCKAECGRLRSKGEPGGHTVIAHLQCP